MKERSTTFVDTGRLAALLLFVVVGCGVEERKKGCFADFVLSARLGLVVFLCGSSDQMTSNNSVCAVHLLCFAWIFFAWIFFAWICFAFLIYPQDLFGQQ